MNIGDGLESNLSQPRPITPTGRASEYNLEL